LLTHFSGDYANRFSVISGLPATVSPGGGSTQIGVRYALPSTSGNFVEDYNSRSVDFSIDSDATGFTPSSIVSTAVTGHVIARTQLTEVKPSGNNWDLSFNANSKSGFIRNDGTTKITINSITLQSTVINEFNMTVVPTAPRDLIPGESISIAIQSTDYDTNITGTINVTYNTNQVLPITIRKFKAP
jgi:hypothetical protein